jgi:hypothetical protein
MMNSVGHITTQGHANVHVGNSYSIHIHTDPNENRCLADLRLTDPSVEKIRIEQTS